MTPKEKIIEKIALLLLSIPEVNPGVADSEDTIRSAADEAADMADRARREWWTIGRPYFNARMESLHEAWNKARRKAKAERKAKS